MSDENTDWFTLITGSDENNALHSVKSLINKLTELEPTFIAGLTDEQIKFIRDGKTAIAKAKGA